MDDEKLNKLLDEIEARANAVMPPRWIVPEPDKARVAHHRYAHIAFVADGDGFAIEVVPTTMGDIPVAEFVAHARTDIPTLISELRLRMKPEAKLIQFAKVVPVDGAYTVAIGSLGVKIFQTLADAEECCKAINNQIVAAIRKGAAK